VELYLYSPYTSVAWCSVEKKHRDNFTFTCSKLAAIRVASGGGGEPPDREGSGEYNE
jgi:hypothetical protein